MYVQGPVGEGRGSFPAVGHGSAMPTPGHSTHGLEGEKEEKRVLSHDLKTPCPTNRYEQRRGARRELGLARLQTSPPSR